jgi:hypothetical protein
MAPTRNAAAACGRLDSGAGSTDPPEPGHDGSVDPAPSFADPRLPGPFQENMTEAAIMDKSGNTPPNIGHFP